MEAEEKPINYVKDEEWWFFITLEAMEAEERPFNSVFECFQNPLSSVIKNEVIPNRVEICNCHQSNRLSIGWYSVQ